MVKPKNEKKAKHKNCDLPIMRAWSLRPETTVVMTTITYNPNNDVINVTVSMVINCLLNPLK